MNKREAMKEQMRIPKKEQEKIYNELQKEFTLGNALNASILGTIFIFILLYMLNAFLLQKFEVIPQISFEEFVELRVEEYEFKEIEGYEDDLIAALIGNMIVLLMQVVIDALHYVLYDVNQTQMFTVASIIGITNIGMILLVYLIIYRNQVKPIVLLISLIIALVLSMLIVNILTFLILSMSLSPLLFGYFGWWILLPSTTIAIPILINWLTGIDWILFWYGYAFLLSVICALSVFVISRIMDPVKKNEKVEKLIEKEARDIDDLAEDTWLWILIATAVGSIVTVVWKIFGKLVVDLFTENRYTIMGVSGDWNAKQVALAYFFIITIGYFFAFMLSYAVYKRAAGKKDWLQLYKQRHTDFGEQIARYLTYTILMMLYWIYSIYIPRRFMIMDDLAQGIFMAMLITFLSVVVGKLATLKPRKEKKKNGK